AATGSATCPGNKGITLQYCEPRRWTPITCTHKTSRLQHHNGQAPHPSTANAHAFGSKHRTRINFIIREMNMFGIKAVCLTTLLFQTKAHEVVKPGALRKGAGGNCGGSLSKGPDEGGRASKEDFVLKYDQATCGCNSCSEAWNTVVPAADNPTATCGGRINWEMQYDGKNEHDACALVASEFPEKCPCDPSTCASIDKCGCESCSEVWDTSVTGVDGVTVPCGGRIKWLMDTKGYNEPDACAQVASEFPQDCLCDPSTCNKSPTPPPTPPPSCVEYDEPCAQDSDCCGSESACFVWDGKCHYYPSCIDYGHNCDPSPGSRPCCFAGAQCQPLFAVFTCRCAEGFHPNNNECKACTNGSYFQRDTDCCNGLICSRSDARCCKQDGTYCKQDSDCCGGNGCWADGKCCSKNFNDSCHDNEECCGVAVCSGNECCVKIADPVNPGIISPEDANCENDSDCCGTAICSLAHRSPKIKICSACQETEILGGMCDADRFCCSKNCRFSIWLIHATCGNPKKSI
ncbi:hypothetical protein ACHAWF_009980, partial [Thalassiosira exigua]